MTDHSVTHATFALERTYDASPERVFRAFADPAAKARWFVGADEWVASPHELDFRVGGQEHISGGPAGGPVHTFNARYQDIVENRRIVSTYEMLMDDTRTSVSVATVELEPHGGGTRLRLTEQGAFFDGLDSLASREEGTAGLLDALGRSLQQQTTSA